MYVPEKAKAILEQSREWLDEHPTANLDLTDPKCNHGLSMRNPVWLSVERDVEFAALPQHVQERCERRNRNWVGDIPKHMVDGELPPGASSIPGPNRDDPREIETEHTEEAPDGGS